MKRSWIVTMWTVCAGIAAAQPVRCTQDTVTGTYALATRGLMMRTAAGSSQATAVPIAGLALVSIDAKGVITSSAYQSVGGQVSQFAMPGTIKVNADCSASVDWGGGITGQVYITAEGAEMRSMMDSGGQMGSPIVSGQWKRISRIPNTEEPNQCAEGSLVGVYAIRQDGMFLMPQPGSSLVAPVPAAMVAVGWVGYDGTGPSTGTASIGGQVIPFSVPNTKFTVKPDCTVGTSLELTSQGTSLGQAAGWGIVLDGGNAAWTIETLDPVGLPVILGVWTRLSPIPPAGN